MWVARRNGAGSRRPVEPGEGRLRAVAALMALGLARELLLLLLGCMLAMACPRFTVADDERRGSSRGGASQASVAGQSGQLLSARHRQTRTRATAGLGETHDCGLFGIIEWSRALPLLGAGVKHNVTAASCLLAREWLWHGLALASLAPNEGQPGAPTAFWSSSAEMP